MNTELKSTADLKRVQKQLRRREMKRKFDTNPITVTFVAGRYRAAYKGSAVAAFGETSQEALQRLNKLGLIRSVIPKHCDVQADREERAAAHAAARELYHNHRNRG
jgi:hypothetical protein